MFRLAAILSFLATSAFAQNHHCIAEDGTELGDMRFHESENAMVDDGDFDVRVTSGYRMLGYKHRFIYCLENLRSSSVHFKWDGPKPNKLLENKLGRPPSDRRTGKFKMHRETTGQADFGARMLHLRRHESESYRPFDVATYVEKALLRSNKILPVQDEPGFPISSGSEFAAALVSLDGPFTLSSGVVFDMPRDEENWAEFLSGGGEEAVESSRVTAELTMQYNPDNLDVSIGVIIGFSTEFPPPDPERFFSGFSFNLGPGFEGFGFENVDSLKPDFEGELPLIRPGFVGISQTRSLGSLAEYVDDQRTLSRGNLPVTLLLDGAQVAEFGLEVIGPPVEP